GVSARSGKVQISQTQMGELTPHLRGDTITDVLRDFSLSTRSPSPIIGLFTLIVDAGLVLASDELQTGWPMNSVAMGVWWCAPGDPFISPCPALSFSLAL